MWRLIDDVLLISGAKRSDVRFHMMFLDGDRDLGVKSSVSILLQKDIAESISCKNFLCNVCGVLCVVLCGVCCAVTRVGVWCEERDQRSMNTLLRSCVPIVRSWLQATGRQWASWIFGIGMATYVPHPPVLTAQRSSTQSTTILA